MTWALVIMLCGRPCAPQYVQLFKTRAECVKVADAGNDIGLFKATTHYCVPVDEVNK